MSEKKYKLTYFNWRALGESIRYIFCAAGVEYEDYRIERDSHEWTQLKSSAPFGQVPMLEVDGKAISQCRAIGRYLAGEFGLLADNAWDNARIDMVVDCLDDMRMPIRATRGARDEETKKIVIASYQEALPSHLAHLQKILCEKNNGDGYFAGDKLTWGDINFAAMIHFVEIFTVQVGIEFPLEKYPKLKSLREKVEAIPGIAAHIASRPQTRI